jgi:hypothetical protein
VEVERATQAALEEIDAGEASKDARRETCVDFVLGGTGSMSGLNLCGNDERTRSGPSAATRAVPGKGSAHSVRIATPAELAAEFETDAHARTLGRKVMMGIRMLF